MFIARPGIATLICCLTASIALGCGDFLGTPMTDDRNGSLKRLPSNSFAFEAGNLVDKPDGIPKINDRQGLYPLYPPAGAESEESDLRDAERASVARDQVPALIALRQAPTGSAAMEGDSILPEAIRLYTAGAIDFRHQEFDAAARRFQAVLDLPDDKSRPRAVWAAYMLGRCAAKQGDAAKAAGAFALARDLLRRGRKDPLHLAIASFGEEALIHLKAARRNLPNLAENNDARTEFSQEISAAVALYADQAAAGSQVGVGSLGFIASDILGDPNRIRATVGDPLVQRLLVAYVVAHDSDAAQYFDRPMEPNSSPTPRGMTLIEAIEQRALDPVPAADRLAALAYDMGRYDLAAGMAGRLSSPLASWVKAKLAVQKGDLDAAAQFYADVAEHFPTIDIGAAVDQPNRPLIAVESGIVALARGQYVEALRLLYHSHYWRESAYVAERVLTTDELRRFVDHDLVKHDIPEPPFDLIEPWDQLHALLARRLMRDGRFDAALPYFPDPTVRAAAAGYARALHDGETASLPIERAKALYEASVIARQAGMAIMGTEEWPDYAEDMGDRTWPEPELDARYSTRGEIARRADTSAQAALRFHYRFVAADIASRAADLLPPRSQAFAAVLCRATGWMLYTQDKEPAAAPKAQMLYARYVKEGAYVPWASHFGYSCPAPDFAAAGRFGSAHRFDGLRNRLGPRKMLALSGVAGLGIAAWLLYRRRRRVAA